MDRCPSCGVALAPGATFCRACGASAPEAAPVVSAAPHRDAAVIYLLVPSLFALYVGAVLALGRFEGQFETLFMLALVAVVALPLARALWVGARWAKPVCALVGSAWTALCTWTALTFLPRLSSASSSVDTAWIVADIVLFVLQGALGVGAVFVLLRRQTS